jgi:hypothetical protein
MADSLNESWSVLRRQLGRQVLDLVWADPGFRLTARMKEALDASFAENALIGIAVSQRWLRAERGVMHETAEYPDLLTRIQVACS